MPPKRKARAVAATETDEADVVDAAGVEYAPETTKRKRQKKTTADKPVVEKRLARYKKTCPQAIAERMDRVMAQRFYMIEREREEGKLEESFKVLGSTGNVYTVVIKHLPSCDCPDASKGNHCKHLLFVLLKVLCVPIVSPHFFQKALLTSELEEIFTAAPLAPTASADQRVLKAYAQATGKAGPSDEAEEVEEMREVDGQDCPVCYEAMKGKTEAELARIVFCPTCKNGLHADCFQMWARKPPITCVYCRAPMDVNPGGTSSSAGTSGGYMNLGRAAGISTKRDTSSYYHGPIKGNRYGYTYD